MMVERRIDEGLQLRCGRRIGPDREIEGSGKTADGAAQVLEEISIPHRDSVPAGRVGLQVPVIGVAQPMGCGRAERAVKEAGPADRRHDLRPRSPDDHKSGLACQVGGHAKKKRQQSDDSRILEADHRTLSEPRAEAMADSSPGYLRSAAVQPAGRQRPGIGPGPAECSEEPLRMARGLEILIKSLRVTGIGRFEPIAEIDPKTCKHTGYGGRSGAGDPKNEDDVIRRTRSGWTECHDNDRRRFRKAHCRNTFEISR